MYSTLRRYLNFWLKCGWLISACPSECMSTLSSPFPLQAEGPSTESCWSHLLIYLESVFLCLYCVTLVQAIIIYHQNFCQIGLPFTRLMSFQPFLCHQGKIWFKCCMGNSYHVLPGTGAAFLPVFVFPVFHLVLRHAPLSPPIPQACLHP